MNPFKICFMGSPEFSKRILKHLVENNFNIACVVTNKDKKRGRGRKKVPTLVKKYAQKKDIKIFQPVNPNNKEFLNNLKKLDVNIIITAAYGKILKKNLLNFPEYKSWNIHTSLLPKYRGAAPIQRAIENGESETGVSIFKMVEKLDAGPIALQEKISINKEDNLENVYEKLVDTSKKAIVSFLQNYKKISLKEQDHNKSTYAKKISKEERELNINKSAYKLFNKIRAFDPIPGVYANLRGERVKLFGAKNYKKVDKEGKIGEVLNIDNNLMEIKTGNGNLYISQIQFPGKKKNSIKDAYNGGKIKKGDLIN